MCVSVFKDFFYPTLSAWRGGKGGERGGMVRERKVVYFIRLDHVLGCF